MKIGIIGLGDMGKLFAKTWAGKGFDVCGCDRPINTESLREELAPFNIQVLENGTEFSRLCDFILYSVEAEKIDDVVSMYGPATKHGAIVAGQTSVKTPEIKAFEKLPKDVQIVTCHALYGPAVSPEGQTLVVINHRASHSAYQESLNIFAAIGSKIEELEDYHAHDKMMADIQAVTHIGFESIGTACMHRKIYPWEDAIHPNGLDNVKFLMTLRIYSYKHHVYSGLALHNPYAKKDVRKYAQVENDLFALMLTKQKETFRKKILKARDVVFKDHSSTLMLDDKIMSEFSLSGNTAHKPNSHLSLLSMVETWHQLGTNPYKNLVCQTPPFKLRVGMAEYLFLNDNLLHETIETAINDYSMWADELAFHTAVQEWANIVELGDMQGYEKHFEKTKAFLKDRLMEGREKSNLLIAKLKER